MRGEPRGEQIVARGEAGGVQKPGQQKGTVWIRS
jgi:hypothetical protein